jgi:hypothetical protein
MLVWSQRGARSSRTKTPNMPAESRYWFPAKRYGWGWGLPVTWQGWLTLVVFLGLIVAGAFLFRPRHAPVPYIIYVVVLSAALTVVCWLKGEPARWRWGADK